MSRQITLDKLEKELVFFHKMYDAVRIVDPIHKKVLESKGRLIQEMNKVCYDYWGNEKICKNCISVRSWNENKSYFKLEHKNDVIMAVTALPVETADRPIVLELFKNVTDSMMIGSGDYNDGNMMYNIISEMNDLVMKDTLTSLYNRRFINDRLPVDIIKASIESLPISIILLDLDNLKYINDTYGHLEGDRALLELGNILNNIIGENLGWSSRYGGDEFLICLNNINQTEVHDIAEEVRKKVETTMFEEENVSIHLSISLGVHTIKEEKLTAEELIRKADFNLYEAKKRGRNCMVLSIE